MQRVIAKKQKNRKTRWKCRNGKPSCDGGGKGRGKGWESVKVNAESILKSSTEQIAQDYAYAVMSLVNCFIFLGPGIQFPAGANFDDICLCLFRSPGFGLPPPGLCSFRSYLQISHKFAPSDNSFLLGGGWVRRVFGWLSGCVV